MVGSELRTVLLFTAIVKFSCQRAKGKDTLSFFLLKKIYTSHMRQSVDLRLSGKYLEADYVTCCIYGPWRDHEKVMALAVQEPNQVGNVYRWHSLHVLAMRYSNLSKLVQKLQHACFLCILSLHLISSN